MLIAQHINLTSANAVLESLTSDLAARGWTLLAKTNDGAGKRAHLAKNGIYIHLRAANAESGIFTDAPGAFSGLALTVGSGYTPTSGWREQPGTPKEKVYGASQAVCSAFNGAANTWLIADDADNTVLVIEAPTGIYQQLAWGPSIAKAAPFTGGAYCWGTQRGTGLQSLAANKTPLAQPFSLYVRADVDSFTGKWVGTGITTEQWNLGWTGKNAIASAQETTLVPMHQPLANRTTSQVNGQPHLLPARIFVARDNGKWSHLGELPLVYETNKVPVGTGTGAGATTHLGDEDYLLFPGIAVKLSDAPPVAVAARAAGQLAPVDTARGQIDGKVLISPASINAGYIANDTAHTLTLWNTSPVRFATGTGVRSSDIYGLELDGGQAMTLKPGSVSQRILLVRGKGKPLLDEQIAFTFEGMRASTVGIKGNRLVLFTLSPDWSQPVVEGTRYKSSLLSTYGGHEQRASLTSKPLRTLTYTAQALTATERAQAEATLYAGQALAIGAPIWTQETRAKAAIQAGALYINADTRAGGFEAGGFAVISKDSRAEVVDIQAVGDDGLTLSLPVTSDWAVGASVAPLLVARLEADLDSASDAGTVAAYNITLTEETA